MYSFAYKLYSANHLNPLSSCFYIFLYVYNSNWSCILNEEKVVYIVFFLCFVVVVLFLLFFVCFVFTFIKNTLW